jgi:hypothetical protein
MCMYIYFFVCFICVSICTSLVCLLALFSLVSHLLSYSINGSFGTHFRTGIQGLQVGCSQWIACYCCCTSPSTPKLIKLSQGVAEGSMPSIVSCVKQDKERNSLSTCQHTKAAPSRVYENLFLYHINDKLPYFLAHKTHPCFR